jgi:HamA
VEWGRGCSRETAPGAKKLGLFEDWCDFSQQGDEPKEFWALTEKAGARDAIRDRLVETVRSHYDDLSKIADDIETLGYPGAAEILRERLPRTKRARSGELGEILATELVEEEVGYTVPVRRLRYKDGREMALRGDDFIGIKEDDENQLRLVKGEAKSRKTLGKATIGQAREALSRDQGRPTATSLLFVADRLLESADAAANALGRKLRNEVARRALPPARIDHVLFTFCANDPSASLIEDLNAADGHRAHFSICFRIEDHQDFIAVVYEGALALGND